MHLPSIRFSTSFGVRDFGPYHNNTERRKSKAVVRVPNNQKSASIRRMRCQIWLLFSPVDVDRRRWSSILDWSHLLTSDLKRCLLFEAHYYGAGTREENTWSTTEGEKQPSGGVRLCDCLSSGCKQDMQSALRGWWLFGADEGEDEESPERFRGCVY